MFDGAAYKPAHKPMSSLEHVVIYRDELETLRLCDLMDMTQEDAAQSMGVSRGTVQRTLASARKKVAEALTGCKALVPKNNNGGNGDNNGRSDVD